MTAWARSAAHWNSITMVVLDEDGNPCRTCNSLTDFQQVVSGRDPSTPFLNMSAKDTAPKGFRDEPPDGHQLGRNTWTLLHSVAAYYPVKPSLTQKEEMTQFLKTFSHFFPCKPCARDFEDYLDENKPKVEDREALSLWMCDAHNAVNTKLGKPTFDCQLWRSRWRDGWEEFLNFQK